MTRRFRHLLEYAAFRGLVAVIHAMPLRLIDAGSTVLAFVIHRLLPGRLTRREIAVENLRRAFGDSINTDRIIGRMWLHLFRTIGEIIHLQRRLSRTSYLRYIRFRNRDPVVAALCSDRPVIMLSGHLGNWELAVWIFGLFGFSMGVVARRLDNPYLDRYFIRFRSDTGHDLLDKSGASGEMIERLESAGRLALLCDQDAGSHGLFVDFFGHPASTFKSIALLALRHEAIICVGYAIRLDRNNGPERFEVGCEELIDAGAIDDDNPVLALTRQYTAALERVIRRAPEQYFWIHRRWKSQPGRRRSRRGPTAPARSWAA
ncbi:MAG: lysophospholipid acyltransferase family protein [Planctomycetaceae bacterium]